MTARPNRPAARAVPAAGRTCRDGAHAHAIERATTLEVDAIAATLTNAFTGYPFTDWTVPGHHRTERLHALFSLTVGRVGIPYGDTFVAWCAGRGQEREIVGAVVAVPPSGAPDDVWASIAAEEERLLADRAEASAQADQATRGLRPSGPHYAIATIGVADHHRRRGLAQALLAPVLASADAEALPAYLETSSVDNVVLYQRAGFTVLDHVALPDGGPTVWGMARPPAR